MYVIVLANHKQTLLAFLRVLKFYWRVSQEIIYIWSRYIWSRRKGVSGIKHFYRPDVSEASEG